jgi:CO/xanthine dehydrogenase FAD-binding subunit
VKPPPFEYEAPATVEQALRLLADRGDDGKVLAGGQSLVPLLNFRLARPDVLIDINGLEALSYLRREDGELRVGALTRHAAAEHSPLVNERWPLVAEALRWVAHPQIRNRGTIGGSVAHADPAAELPVVLTALDASFTARSARGQRELTCQEMFQGQLENGLTPDELLTEIRIPSMPAASGWSFQEYSRRHGDYALGGAAVALSLDDDGGCAGAAIALLGAGPTPVRPAEAEVELLGRAPREAAAAAAAEAVRGATPTGDLHGSADYRRGLIETLVQRAIHAATERAERSRAS